jgi:peroxiredoxin
VSKQTKWAVGLTLGFTLLFCASFVFFFQRAQQKATASAKEPVASAKAIGKPLPLARFVDSSDQILDDQTIRKGRVILVFGTPDCNACKREAQFLKTVVDQRQDVRFYGVISFGEKKSSLLAAEQVFPFKVFFDEKGQLAAALGIDRVPIKIFLENGIIQKAWGGATVDENAKLAFSQWLNNLPESSN